MRIKINRPTSGFKTLSRSQLIRGKLYVSKGAYDRMKGNLDNLYILTPVESDNTSTPDILIKLLNGNIWTAQEVGDEQAFYQVNGTLEIEGVVELPPR